MNPELYQRLASRTESDQLAATRRLSDVYPADPAAPGSDQLLPARVNHAVVGLMGEVGELASAVEKWVYYGGKLDVANVKEEAGDCLWYLAQLLNSVGLSMGDVMEANVLKLKTRYPEKFSTWESANRDLQAERRALEEIHAGLPRAGVTSDSKQEEDARGQVDYSIPLFRQMEEEASRKRDATLTSAAHGHAPTVHAGPGRDWGCSCGKINAPYDKECGGCGKASPLPSGTCEKALTMQHHTDHEWDSDEANARCRKCRAHRDMESGYMSCPVRPYIVQGESSSTFMREIKSLVDELPPVRPHSSHEWDSDAAYTHCRKCGAYKHLGSGFLRCRGTPKVDDQSRVQDGHGWSEPEVIEGEY